MEFVSWNVNGVRAVHKKGFLDWLDDARPDVLALQEIKASPDQLPEDLRNPKGYHAIWTPAERPGYSGTATLSRVAPTDLRQGFGEARFDAEGRVTVTRHESILLFNVYFPNGGQGDERLAYKLDFYDALLAHLNDLVAQGESVVVCGDLNTAHREIDLARPKQNRKNSGFMPIECEALDRWFEAGWVDAFRHLHPEARDCYTWWTYRAGARERNVGWRLDTHLVSPDLADHIRDARILKDIQGSDHCPVLLALDL